MSAQTAIYNLSSYLSQQMRRCIVEEKRSTLRQKIEYTCAVHLLQLARRAISRLYARGITSRPEQASALVCKWLRKGDIYVDVGASIGKTSCYASYRVGKTGKVFSFEPLPSAAMELRTIVSAMKLTNVGVEQAAVAAESGSRIIYEREHQPASSLFESFNANLSPVLACHQCTVTTLNDFVQTRNLNRVDLIKIDVEGAEFDVLRGATELINPTRRTIQSSPVLIIEINAREERATLLDYTISEMIDWLSNREYTCTIPRSREFVAIKDERQLRNEDMDMVCWVPGTRPGLAAVTRNL